MAKFYALRIKSGKMTLNEVPERWRNEVEILLEGVANEKK